MAFAMESLHPQSIQRCHQSIQLNISAPFLILDYPFESQLVGSYDDSTIVTAHPRMYTRLHFPPHTEFIMLCSFSLQQSRELP